MLLRAIWDPGVLAGSVIVLSDVGSVGSGRSELLDVVFLGVVEQECFAVEGSSFEGCGDCGHLMVRNLDFGLSSTLMIPVGVLYPGLSLFGPKKVKFGQSCASLSRRG